MTLYYPPYHIKSVAINSSGWVVPSSKVDEDLKPDEIPTTKSCREFLQQIKVDLNDAVFARDNCLLETSKKDDTPATPLEELPLSVLIGPKIDKLVSDIRKMGDTIESTSLTRKQRKTMLGSKVAQLEEQRQNRQQKEEQEVEQHAIKSDNVDTYDGFVTVGAHHGAPGQISLDARLAMTFNSLRILVTVLRPAISHPQRQDLELRMKYGPNIQKSGKAHRYYLFFDRAYSCITVGAWKQVNRDLRQLFDDMGVPMERAMQQTKDGQYVFNVMDWIASVVETGDCLDDAVVASKCFEEMPKDADVESQLHDALMNRFDFARDKNRIGLERSIEQLQKKLTDAIARKFKGVHLTVYGSCLSGLALEGSHDVDISVHIPYLQYLKHVFDDGKITAEKYEQQMRRTIFQVRDALLSPACGGSFVDVFAITRARVPVIKAVDQHADNPYSADGHLNFDLCFLNDIAVVNSSLLREYSLLDKRVRVLMLCVKSFGKKNGISSAADNTFSSYSWLNLVVFYLQCINFLPVLQCPKLLEQHSFQPDRAGNRWHYINSLETYYLAANDIIAGNIWSQPACFSDTSMPKLLYGFFSFYSSVFPRESVAASIRFGDCSLHKASFEKSSRLWRLSVEDPFETHNSHCPHDLGSHVNEIGQKKILHCLANGLQTLHNLLGGKLKPVKATEFLFDVIGCNAAKPQLQARNSGNYNNQMSHPKPRPGSSGGKNNDQYHVAYENFDHQSQARSLENIWTNGIRGGSKAQDAHHTHYTSQFSNQRNNYPNKTLDAMRQVAEHSNEETGKNRPRTRYNRRPGRRRERRLAQQQNEMNSKAAVSQSEDVGTVLHPTTTTKPMKKATEARVNAELKNQRSIQTSVQPKN